MSKLVPYRYQGTTRWSTPKQTPVAPAPDVRKMRDFFGEVLLEKRKEKGLKLRDVSSNRGVSLGYLSEVERGKKEASSEILESLCDSLGMKPSEFLYNTAKKLEEAGK